MEQSRGHIARTNRGSSAPKSSSKAEQYADEEADIIFLATWARKLSAKHGGKKAGMTAKGFQKVQAGDNGISYKKLTRWLKQDIDFAMAYFAHVGLLNPGEAEFAGAFTRAVQAYQRRQQ